MSDSGKQLGDCPHNRDPHWCVDCLRAKAALVPVMLEVLKLVRRKWTFNNDQQPTHTWHSWADCTKQIEDAIKLAEGRHQ